MKKTESPYSLYSSQRKHSSTLQGGDTSNGTDKKGQRKNNFTLQGGGTSDGTDKTHPALKFFKVAVKKFSGIFSIFLFSKKKAASKIAINDGSRKKGQIGGIACEFHRFHFALILKNLFFILP